MTALSDRIVEVLREHTWGIFRDDAGFAHSGCMCQVGAKVDYPAHVAERIAELFTEQRGTQKRGGSMRDRKRVHRWVSAWSEVEP